MLFLRIKGGLPVMEQESEFRIVLSDRSGLITIRSLHPLAFNNQNSVHELHQSRQTLCMFRLEPHVVYTILKAQTAVQGQC